jgi:hypothetical protein
VGAGGGVIACLRPGAREEEQMPIAVTDKIVALLVSLSPSDLEDLPLAVRRRLADHCRHAADLAERQSLDPTAAEGERQSLPAPGHGYRASRHRARPA